MVTITGYETKAGKRYRVRYRKPDGTQTDKRGFKRKLDAETWAAEHVTVAKARGEYIDPRNGNITVRPLYEAWMAKKRISAKESYYHTLEGAWAANAADVWDSRRVNTITREEVQRWAASIADGTGTRDGRPRSATVVIRVVDMLAGILDDAVADRRIPSNPARGIAKPRKRKRRHVYLTAAELYAVADGAKWRRDIVLTLGLCGMRWGELAALRVRDVDLERHRLHIGASASTVAGKVVVSDTKTYTSRSIMYPEMLDGMMRHRCEGRDDDDLLFEAPHRPGEYLSNADGPTSPDGWFAVALRRAGIDKGHMTVHDLRHTAASLMVSAGANVKAVQRQLGHRSAAMTLDTYADLFDDDLDDLSAAMSDMLARENVGKMWAERNRVNL